MDATSHRPLVAIADGPDCPALDPGPIAAGIGIEDYRLLIGWTLREPPWLERAPAATFTVLGGYGLTRVTADGRVSYLPIRLSAMPRMLAEALRPAVAVVAGRPTSLGFAFAGSVGWGLAAARCAEQLVIEVREDAPPLDTPLIEGNVLQTIAREAPLDPPPRYSVDQADRRIAEIAADLIPKGATLQHGPGRLASALFDAVHRPARIHSGVVSDGLVELDRRSLLVGRAESSYLCGGEELIALAAEGKVRLRAVDEIHDPARLAAIERFVSFNTAIEVGLDGAVNVERVDGRVVAGIGGHADFCAAASRSPGGLSIIAVRATADGRSTIVSRPVVVSTPRCDVDVVVTEHGMADLRGADDRTRAERLISIAGPEHRDTLARQARMRPR